MRQVTDVGTISNLPTGMSINVVNDNTQNTYFTITVTN